MEYLRFLKQQSSALSARFIAIAIIAGVSNGILVGVIISGAGETAEGTSKGFRTLLLFTISFLLFTLTRKHILDGTSVMVEKVIREIRIRIVEMVPHTELPAFERIGRTRISQALSQDVQSISEAAYTVTSAFASAILVACAFLYIATMSLAACVIILGLLALGAFIYWRNYKASIHLLDASWQSENAFFDHLADLLQGFNELKLNPAKAKDLLDNDVKAMALRSEEHKLGLSRSFNWNMVFGQSFFYAVMAVVLFIMPRVLDHENLPVLQILSVIMFINGPIAEIIAAVPFLAKANFAIQKLNTLEAELRTVAVEQPEAPIAFEPFRSLRCSDLTFHYPRVEGQREFTVGPLDLELRRGEITFLIGGNGTGKSTFLKLLCGLITADGGSLQINDHPITPSRLAFYRSYFAIVLQDFWLFRRLIGVPEVDHGHVDDLLGMLRMTGITQVDSAGKFTTTRLSTGQKKRLALMVVELDNREIYVFDEWAADQDPEFRKYFYEVYLPQLRDRGKTVIAATHDDHYFHAADRVIKLDNGRIASITSMRGAEPEVHG